MKSVLLFLSLVFSTSVAFPTEISSSYEKTRTWQEKLSDILPNATSFGISSETTNMEIKDRENLNTRNRPFQDGPFSKVSALTSNLSLIRTPKYSLDRKTFDFIWSPLVTFAFRNLSFESKAAFLDETDFQMLRSSAGIGPQVSFNSHWGTLYLEFVPGVAYSWVSWSSPVAGGSVGQWSLNSATTLGYYYCFNKLWTAQLFVRSLSEDPRVWKTAFDRSQGGFEIQVERVNSTASGFSISRSF